MLRAERIAKRRRLVEETLAGVERTSGASLSALLPEQQAVRLGLSKGRFAILLAKGSACPVPSGPPIRVIMLRCGSFM